jgi:hypothetical protein
LGFSMYFFGQKLIKKQERHGKFEPGKAQYSNPIFFWPERIETQNLGKVALPAEKWFC